MQWQDTGILIGSSPFKEHDLIVSFITKEHGLAKGLVKGGLSKKQKPLFQIGNKFNITWKSRLEEQLGFFITEPIKLYGNSLYDIELKLKLLASATGILYDCLTENTVVKNIYNETISLLQTIEQEKDELKLLYDYMWWEFNLIKELGFAFNLSKCNATGTTKNLVYISPATGCAISQIAGEKYKSKMLTFPILWQNLKFLNFSNLTFDNINETLKVLEFFINKRFYLEKNKPIPYLRKTIYIKM